MEARSIKPTSARKRDSKIDRPEGRVTGNVLRYARRKETERERRTLYFFHSRPYDAINDFPVKNDFFLASRGNNKMQRTILQKGASLSRGRALQWRLSAARPSSLLESSIQTLVDKLHLQPTREDEPPAVRVNIYRTPTAKCTKGMLCSPMHVEGANAASCTLACS